MKGVKGMRSTLTCRGVAALTLALVSAAAWPGGKPPSTATHPSQQPTTLGPARTGQPNQSCETTPNTPGLSANAPGSAFNPSGKAGTVYAGEQPQNSRNTASVSQYDVACTRR
jgi:hypothetical protein